MPHSELSEYNFKRISLINWGLCFPLILLFGWPFLFLCSYFKIEQVFAFPGAFLFSLPFLFTILHGHVTMALGASHRHHYYEWLTENPYSYGILFHNLFTKTRFRLALLAASVILFAWGYFSV
ncbi:hypothetical protein NC796_13270 [Aliifodinibius sp. S!AR15-10]|uniref:hypothetical protein n=1 Tax=Aliifodinibius sp. S!AR15-10 TaxID=2950437 RepID=UPI00285E8B5A|nr:hypothetical protein [Aliifodinibius sp. S!AR15-10]MDR8392118.1 hypothetical protein [Aliifodinibius sp. S!AR15-10]